MNADLTSNLKSRAAVYMKTLGLKHLDHIVDNHDHLWHLQGKKEYLRNHLTPNPRTYVSTRGYTFSKKAGQ